MRYNILAGTPIVLYALDTIAYNSNVVTFTDHDCVIDDNELTCIIEKWRDTQFGFVNNTDVYLRFPSDMTNEGKMFWLILLYKDVVTE